MFKLRLGYLLTGIATGLILITSFIATIPDGKLHIIICDVGQGDSAYIKFPDGRDMLIDGGPNNRVLECLGNHMPFWDRHIDIVALSHPQKDHVGGLVSVLERYDVGYVIRSDTGSNSEVHQKFLDGVAAGGVQVKYLAAGSRVEVGSTALTVLWPSKTQLSMMEPVVPTGAQVLGARTDKELNNGSLVLLLRYGSFDALFPGDADTHVESGYVGMKLADDGIELLKVPHHGSKTGMSREFLEWLRPKLAVISVGKNSYGHPTKEAIALLRATGAMLKRTDEEGDVEIISDGSDWRVVD